MKHTGKKDRAILRIKMELLNGRIKEAVELAEKREISPKEFGKIVKEINK